MYIGWFGIVSFLSLSMTQHIEAAIKKWRQQGLWGCTYNYGCRKKLLVHMVWVLG